MSGSVAFLEWLDTWSRGLPAASLRGDVLGRGDPSRAAVLVVDLLVGFCSEGPLASPRVGSLVEPVSRFLQLAHEAGVRHFLCANDSHPPDALEFRAFPPHCVQGTREAELAPELAALPFSGLFTLFPKNSLNVGLTPGFGEWLEDHPEVDTWVCLGDCTDLCVYHEAMHLCLRANQVSRDVEVWVPADLVDTYDLPVAVAQELDVLPHDGDLLHRMALYQMALNGIRVVGCLGP